MISACFSTRDTMVRTAAALLMNLLAAPVTSETIEVGNRGAVDLGTFECRDVTRSSVLQRVCYDADRRYLIVAVKGVYDQYCDLPETTFDSLLTAPSMGQFFNRNISGASGGPYDCRRHSRP